MSIVKDCIEIVINAKQNKEGTKSNRIFGSKKKKQKRKWNPVIWKSSQLKDELESEEFIINANAFA